MPNGKPNILVIWGDDIGISNLSCYSDGLMAIAPPTSTVSPARACALPTPAASRAAPPRVRRSSAARASYRTGMSKVGIPGADVGWAADQVGDVEYQVHIDGVNLLPYLMGEVEHRS